MHRFLLWPTVLVGFLAAVYTAFLFGQCEGRDLWQTPLLPVHLIVQALMCGAAVLALAAGRSWQGRRNSGGCEGGARFHASFCIC